MGDFKDVGSVFDPNGMEVRVAFASEGLIGNPFYKVYYRFPLKSWVELADVRVLTSNQAREKVENFLRALDYLGEGAFKD
jgi:hypothetical protein